MQQELLQGAVTLSREGLRRKAKGPKSEVKSGKASFALPGGVSVRLQGRELTLDGAIEALLEAVRELKRGLKQHLDIDTIQRVMRDRAR